MTHGQYQHDSITCNLYESMAEHQRAADRRRAAVDRNYTIVRRWRMVPVLGPMLVSLVFQQVMSPPLFTSPTAEWTPIIFLGTQIIWAVAAFGTWLIYRFNTTLGVAILCNHCGYELGEAVDAAISSSASMCPECGAKIRRISAGIEQKRIYSRSDARTISMRFVLVWFISTGVWALRWML